MPQLCVHGNSALSDGEAPVAISLTTSAGAHVTPPPGILSFPYQGRVHFLFQNPPMQGPPAVNISELHVTGHAKFSKVSEIDLFSGLNQLFSRTAPLFPDADLLNTTINVDDQKVVGDANAGLDFVVTITFNSAIASHTFESAKICY